MSKRRTLVHLSNLSACMSAAALTLACGGGGDASPVTVAVGASASGSAGTVTATVSNGMEAPVSALSTTLAAEGQSFVVAGTQTVRYGAGNSWATKEVSGMGSCTNAFFGTDPAVGALKSCQSVEVPASTTASTTPMIVQNPLSALMPAIDLTRLATAAMGYATARVQPANVADASQNPQGSDIGAFREYCEFSHMNYDDPIVYPGAAGAHLHTFFGNSGLDRNTTASTIATTGNSTCAGGTLNRTGYWVPTMIDTKGGTPLKPAGSLFYYKQGYHYVTAASIKAFPAGLKMIAGSAASSNPQGNNVAGFTCAKPDGTSFDSPGIPTDCPVNSTLLQWIVFPQCWDGTNLDSPDHKSHMAYATTGCPSSHPVALTEITMRVGYPVTTSDGTRNWRLSSDNYDKGLPGGYSSHADWFNGWDSSILATWTARCIVASMDCHAFLIGDGRILY